MNLAFITYMQAKKQRLANLQRSSNLSVAGGLASVGDEFGAHYLGDGASQRPRNYKQERAARERAPD